MDKKNYISILKKMILLRRFEEKVAEIAKKNEIQTPVHLYIGQEAIAASICESLITADQVYSTHRSHGHYLAKGGDAQKLMSEIYCREDGCSRGRGGSMHIIDREVNFMLSSPIVGGSISIAVGSAFAAKYLKSGNVSVAFFGDGATDEGVFYESVNFAVLNKLPMIFVCENNDFSTHLPGFTRQSNPVVVERVKGFKINSVLLDGNDPIEIYEKTKELVDNCRQKSEPLLIECNTYRWLSHVGYWQDLDVGFRKKEDVLAWMEKCPIKKMSSFLLDNKYLTSFDIQSIDDEIKTRVDRYAEYSRVNNSPDPTNLSMGLYS